jgi:AcrR family transcriptional regulator
MARPPDPKLEQRILKAARKLWRQAAGTGLTMREVAKAAGTNTPAVYRRFRNRDAILRALLQQTRQEVGRELARSSSVEEACEIYVDYALSHPREYELYYLYEYKLFFAQRGREATLNETIRQKRPVVEFMKGKVAAQIGGKPDDHSGLILALWALLNGTATILIAKTIPPEHAEEMRAACRASVKTLLRAAANPGGKSGF